MHIPSERVYNEMRSEEASLWVVPANGGEEIAILVKAPTPSVKALIENCGTELIFGLHGHYMCLGIRIFDIPESPLFISGVVRHNEEHRAILKILEDKVSPIFLFNEMDICLAWSNIAIGSEEVLNFIGDIENLYVGDFDEHCSHVLDCFCYSTDNTQTYSNALEIPFINIKLSIEPWRSNNNHFYSVRESHAVLISDRDEGEVFERAIWASLESVFPLTLYKSPEVKIGDKTRELTDVLAFHQYGSFLIEAKDLSVLKAGAGRSLDRRTKGVQKQVKKAIGQLIGSCKALKRGEKIYAASGAEISVERENPPHCIVLITELNHSGDWSEIVAELIKAIESTGAFFHLLDFRELIALLKGSSGRAELLDYNLIERCKSFIQCRSVHIRSQPAPNKSMQPTAGASAD
ncbi:hypothetical protein JCM30760_10380 [Thiomicrorhabdus hydrogeniphila]